MPRMIECDQPSTMRLAAADPYGSLDHLMGIGELDFHRKRWGEVEEEGDEEQRMLAVITTKTIGRRIDEAGNTLEGQESGESNEVTGIKAMQGVLSSFARRDYY